MMKNKRLEELAKEFIFNYFIMLLIIIQIGFTTYESIYTKTPADSTDKVALLVSLYALFISFVSIHNSKKVNIANKKICYIEPCEDAYKLIDKTEEALKKLRGYTIDNIEFLQATGYADNRKEVYITYSE